LFGKISLRKEKMKKLLFFLCFSLPILGSAWQCCPVPCESECDKDLYAKDNCAIALNAELLYWTAEAGNLRYAIKQTHEVWQTQDNYPQGKYQICKFDWKPGFRISAGYVYGPKFWEIVGQYTWMSLSGKNSVHAPNIPLYLDGTWPHLFSDSDLATDYMLKASTKIDVDLNLADLLAARVFVTNPHFRIKLIGGFTGGRITEDWKIYYSATKDRETMWSHKWKYTGIGFRTGLNMDWFWTHDLYLTGKVTFAGLIGKYDYKLYATTNSTNNNQVPAIPAADSCYRDWRFAYNMQLHLGPSWQKAFCNSRWEIFLGYEFNNWSNLQEIFAVVKHKANNERPTYPQSSQLTFHGAILRLSSAF
jgi:hypothetical protein